MKKCLISFVSLMLVLSMMLAFTSCAPAPAVPEEDEIFLEIMGSNLPTDEVFETPEIFDEVAEPVVDVETNSVELVDTNPATEGLELRVAASGEYAYVYRYVGTAKDVYVPFAYEGVPVVSVGYSAFDGKAVVSVDLPDTLKTIGEYAFRNCTALASFNAPMGLEEIAPTAFLGTSSLATITADSANPVFKAVDNCLASGTKIVLGSSSATIPADTNVIGKYAFSGKDIKSIDIPDSISVIETGAFANCQSLAIVSLPDTLTAIPDTCFLNCKLISAVDFPAAADSIGFRAFAGCTNISSVVIPANIKNVGDYSFEGCSKLANLTIEEGVINIGAAAFKDCNVITRVDFPNSVESIGASCFWNCASLAYVTLGANNDSALKSIGGGCFYACKNLRPVFISSKVSYMGAKVFAGCTFAGDGVDPAFKALLERPNSYYEWEGTWSWFADKVIIPIAYSQTRP